MGDRDVTARVFGKLAAHRKPEFTKGEDEDLWTVTHIPTGFAVKAGITKEAARYILNALGKEDWNFTRPRDCPRSTSLAAAKCLRELATLERLVGATPVPRRHATGKGNYS